MVFGSKGSWLIVAPATEGESMLVKPPFTVVAAVLLAVVAVALLEAALTG